VFGLVVAENMLRALPVVASDLGAFVESWATRVSLSVLETRPHSPRALPSPGRSVAGHHSWAKRPPACGDCLRAGYMIDSHANVYRRVHSFPRKPEGCAGRATKASAPELTERLSYYFMS